MQYKTTCSSPLGPITLASDGEALTGLWFESQKYYGASLTESAVEENLPVFEETKNWLRLYFDGTNPASVPPCRLHGSPFSMEVWEILRTIPYGQTMTYGEIARLIAARRGLSSMSAQAVGNAVGHNPISIIIPCHRVVGSNRSLTGYAGGIEKKIHLLALEGIDTNSFSVPKKGTAL